MLTRINGYLLHHHPHPHHHHHRALLFSSLLWIMLIQQIGSRLVPIRVNNNNQWAESMTPKRSNGPLLWPRPQRYWVDRKHPPYRISPWQDVGIRMINLEDQMMKCDIIKYNVGKYGRIINEFVESVRSKSSSSSNCHHHFDNRSRQSWLNEVHIIIEDFHCEDDVYPDFIVVVDHDHHHDHHDQSSNETYRIEVQPNSGKALLQSRNVWGMIHALETFTQLLYVANGNHDDDNINDRRGAGCSEILINVGLVQDHPRFSYRSMMIDTSRHFIPVSVLLKNLDAMSYNKMNIFHWHMNDDQSFPFESEIFKNFSRLAAYRRWETDYGNLVYTKRDIQKVVREARLRGIQVLLELDTPAHNLALGKVFPACPGSGPTSNIINPSTESTYQIIEQLLSEWRPLVTANHIHLGMDDVTYECWSQDLDIIKFMHENKMNSFEQLEQYHLHRMIRMVEQFNFKPIIWQDPFDKNIPLSQNNNRTTIIIQVWKDRQLLDNDPREWRHHVQRIVNHNHSVIVSACYFLSLIKYGQDWQQLYECDPHDLPGATEWEKSLVLGGEACLWTEYIDETNLLSRAWPRASAVAERLWSSSSSSKMSETNDADADDDGNGDEVDVRLDAQRCRMLRRGIPAQPISTGFCEHSNNHHDDPNNNNNNNNGNNVDYHITGAWISSPTNTNTSTSTSSRYPDNKDHSNEWNNMDDNNNHNNNDDADVDVQLKHPIIMQQRQRPQQKQKGILDGHDDQNYTQQNPSNMDQPSSGHQTDYRLIVSDSNDLQMINIWIILIIILIIIETIQSTFF